MPVAASDPPAAHAPLATSLIDFFQAGSQPSGAVVYDTFVGSGNCKFCHAQDGDTALAIHGPWQGSMMSQSARDPLFYACLTIANQDAAFAGDLCLRCHTPSGWISGRSEPTDGSALLAVDRDGVNCSVCHRMVDPVFEPGESPPIDQSILAAIQPLPLQPGGANVVFDPEDRRRGPYDSVTNPGHPWLASGFMRSAELCGTCHDVSNPAYWRQTDGTYRLTQFGREHPTGNKYDMFPLERTYSEWLHSEFARRGVDMGGRFGGSRSVVRTCQDCHMPVEAGKGCMFAGVREDLAAHEFAGGNTWVQDMIWNLYPNDGLDAGLLEAGKERSRSMLERACTLDGIQQGNQLTVRVRNETGHKLPTGYPEGRRMWIHLSILDQTLAVLEERGRYDAVEAVLTTNDTKVYEIRLGLDEAGAALTGLPAGEGFHFAVNNRIFKDNRIPPRGFANAAYRAAQAMPVGATYADGQFSDDTTFRLPQGASLATIDIYYQTASREFISFLQDENRTDARGKILYEQWNETGRSPPVLMASKTIHLHPFASGDADGDGVIGPFDFAQWIGCFQGPSGGLAVPGCEIFDFDSDNDIDLSDLAAFQQYFGAS